MLRKVIIFRASIQVCELNRILLDALQASSPMGGVLPGHSFSGELRVEEKMSSAEMWANMQSMLSDP